MIRLFVRQNLEKNISFPLDEKAAHYLLHVMRLKQGDEILCFNGVDGEWKTRIEIKNRKNVLATPITQIRAQEHPDFLALCPALIKKDNFDFVLQKATELGVTDIFPLLTDHTVHPHFNQAHAELVVREAAEQSERLTLPTIHQPLPLSKLKAALPKECILCYLAERKTQENHLPRTGKIAFLVGPEGGWSEKETAFLQENSHILGLHFDCGILRAETASIAILSCWQIGRSLNWKK